MAPSRWLAMPCILGLLLGTTISGKLSVNERFLGLEAQAHSGTDWSLFPQTASQWQVDPTPEVSIGLRDGPEPYLLLNVIDATVLRNGTIVVGLYYRSLFELRYYDSLGVHITSSGRYGNGPFEIGPGGFSSVERLSGDSVLVIGLDHRFSVFGPRGEQVRSGRLPLPGSSIPSQLLDDQHLSLWTVQRVGSESFGREVPSEMSFQVFDIDSGISKPAGRVFDQRTRLDDSGLFLHLPFEPRAHWASGAGRLWFGNSGTAEIQGFNPATQDPEILLLDDDRRSVTRDDEQSWKEFDLRGTNGDRRRQFKAYHRRVEFPESFPFFQDLQVDVSGNVWVLSYEPPWSERDYVWRVFESGGGRIATAVGPYSALDLSIRTDRPSPFSPIKEIGDDYVLTLHKDELGVEQVRKYRLIKGT
ncbi:MAG: hypothetical protein MUO50_13115 [Longimicrobiales bacterium]|nr:hypothetical protein [Longimicrobiales bacterium]